MAVHRIAAVVLRQLYLLRGSAARVVPLFAWALIDIVLWGFISKHLNTVMGTGPDFVRILLGAVLLWDFCARVMHGVATAFLEDVWSRNFLNLFATPLTIGEYVAGLVLFSVATSAVGLVAMLALATAAFGLSVFAYGILIVPFLLVLFLFGIALGVLSTALLLRLGPASEWFVWPLPALLSPFVGVFYPLATLPPWMQAISYALPPSYVFENLRAVVAGQPVSWAALAWSTGLSVLYILFACWVFARVYQAGVRTGLIARYSAESMN